MKLKHLPKWDDEDWEEAVSTDASFDYQEDVRRNWVYCRICDGKYINPEWQTNDRPSNVCLWCWSRNTLYERWLTVKDIWPRRES